MWHIGVALHRRTAVLAAVHDDGRATKPKTLRCQDTDGIQEHVRRLSPFRAVIEATATYRRLHDLLSQDETVLLAHPSRSRLMVQRRAKTDKLDCQLLANLLRINQLRWACCGGWLAAPQVSERNCSV